MDSEIPKHGDCLTEEVLTCYLEGELEPVLTLTSEGHLLSCRPCREKLRSLMLVLNPHTTTGERAFIQEVEEQWHTHRATVLPSRRTSIIRHWFFPCAAVAAVILLTASFLLVNRRDVPQIPQSAGAVVELLLEQSRPYEGRLSGQAYRGIVRTRAGEPQPADYDLLATALTRMDPGPYDLGRFYLLEGHLDDAVGRLEAAIQQGDSRTQVHNDLGVAYLERGGEGDLQRATHQFDLALQEDAAFAPAVFNLSLAYERRGMTVDANREWNRYLLLDSQSGWSEEVRSKMEEQHR